ncbi:MAG: caspase family protein [Gallionella sp.]|nr:caspase family protein [Gallionella sp.]
MSSMHVFAVAVEKYQDNKIPDVIFAENDATAFVSAWNSLGVDHGNCTILLSQKATLTTIRSNLKRFLKNLMKDETAIIFYAGHGLSVNGESYITAHDSQPEDYPSTSLPLNELFQLVKKSQSKRVMIFLDSCHSGLPITSDMRSITSHMTDAEIEYFCHDSEFHVGFASCKDDEVSWPSTHHKHGIWTYCLLQALTGKAKDAFHDKHLITSESLQNYLIDEIPRTLRQVRFNKEVQTPCMFGNSTKTFVVASLVDLLAKEAAKSSDMGPIFKDGFFRGEEIASIATLSGFNKRIHRLPDAVTNATEAFVQSVGVVEVDTRGTSLWDELKGAFNLKQKDIQYSSSDSDVSITTPDFTVEISLTQHPTQITQYRLRTEVKDIRHPEIVTQENFQEVFSSYCNSVIVEFKNNNFPVEDMINQIEDIPELSPFLKSNPTASSLTLNLTSPAPELKILISKRSMKFSLPRSTGGNLGLLLGNLKQAVTFLSGAGVTLLPDKSIGRRLDSR